MSLKPSSRNSRSEIGSARVFATQTVRMGTEQIDAMKASAVDPYKFLVATRVVACILTLPL
jgi:phospholipid/cholesterol/gamma-HCH transport system permease protein